MAACREQRTQVQHERVPTAAGATSASRSGCPARFADARIDADSIAGLSTHATIGELRAQCPGTHMDSVGVGGTSAAALRFDAPGVTLWAIQADHDAYGDSLHGNEPADLWAATGDSLRFADGRLIPMRVGSLRMLDSVGIVTIDHGDDGDGTQIIRCSFPRVSLVIDNMWPSFADSGVVSLTRVSPHDTTRIWRVEVLPARSDSSVVQQCRRGFPR